MSETASGALQIVQIAPQIAPGSGVAGVAYELERALIAKGAHVTRFTEAEARGHPGRQRSSRIGHARDVIWFSIVGTRRARAFLSDRPDAVSICHNDALVGDMYVNHGLLSASMRARGHYVWRMVCNPLHLFTSLRDRIRYQGSFHRVIIALTAREASLLTETYGAMRAPIEVIPNGVDLGRFRTPTPGERQAARRALGVSADDWVAVFIGHEFDRKGLPLALDALAQTPEVRLLVVGGTQQMIERARGIADRRGVSDSVTFTGPLRDVVPPLWAADALLLPSAYEANALVVLESLACGVPVVATPVGAAPDLIVDGVNGYIIDRDAGQLAARLAALRDPLVEDVRAACRATAERYSWGLVAERYLDLARRLQAMPTARGAVPREWDS